MATNKAADPDTLVIAAGFEQRDELIAAAPAIYYLKDHYQSYPVVLVRLARIRPDALESLVREAWHFVDTPRNEREPVRPRFAYELLFDPATTEWVFPAEVLKQFRGGT